MSEVTARPAVRVSFWNYGMAQASPTSKPVQVAFRTELLFDETGLLSKDRQLVAFATENGYWLGHPQDPNVPFEEALDLDNAMMRADEELVERGLDLETREEQLLRQAQFRLERGIVDPKDTET